MQPFFRKSMWLAASIAAALSLTFGSVLAHEGREVGEYRFVVGWMEEPTYEGLRNGVELPCHKDGPGCANRARPRRVHGGGDCRGRRGHPVGRPRRGGPCGRAWRRPSRWR